MATKKAAAATTAKRTLSTKLMDLATERLKMSDNEKALEALSEKVEDNEMLFANEIHAAKKAVKSSEKTLDALSSDPSATPAQIISAMEAEKVAQYRLTVMEEIASARF
jgi:hypothetical protein